MWHQTAGDAAVFSLGYHCFDQRLIIIELEMAGTGALIKAIVCLLYTSENGDQHTAA